MNETVYIESSVISYLKGKRSRDIITAGIQELTVEWWEDKRIAYELFVSESVLREIKQGDESVARKRIEAVKGLPVLVIDDESIALSEKILREAGLPEKAAEDALHIAIAATNGIEYILSRNCRHIANAKLIPKVKAVCNRHGYECPQICAPQKLME